MITLRTPKQVLAELVQIKRMERGYIRTIQRHTGYAFHTLSAYENGKTVTRYVRKDEVDDLRKLTDAYQRFEALVKEYEDLVVQKTRQERQVESGSRRGKSPIKVTTVRINQ